MTTNAESNGDQLVRHKFIGPLQKEPDDLNIDYCFSSSSPPLPSTITSSSRSTSPSPSLLTPGIDTSSDHSDANCGNTEITVKDSSIYTGIDGIETPPVCDTSADPSDDHTQPELSINTTALGSNLSESDPLALNDIDSTTNCATDSSNMKGDVVTPSLPTQDTRSPMIHIPASVVSEFMKSDSAASPLVSNATTKNIAPISNGDQNKKTVSVIGKENVVENCTNLDIGLSAPKESTKDNLMNGELSSTPLLGSTPVEPGPTKPSSPAAMSLLSSSSMSSLPDLPCIDKSTEDVASLSSLEDTPSLNGFSQALLTPLAPVASNSVATPVFLANDELPRSSDITELSPLKSTASHSVVNTLTVASNDANEVLDVRNSATAKVGHNSGLKRPIPSDDELSSKKQKLAAPVEEMVVDEAAANPSSGTENSALIESEVEKLKFKTAKLRKMKRKDLERTVIELFMNKVLHNHELGKYKSLCEKLEATLEVNRKKTAQFHKELEDLRKVTKKLREEHAARKEHLVTPIKIKRSVGVQASPHIIQKTLAAAEANKNGINQSITTVTPSNHHSNHQPGINTSSVANPPQQPAIRTSIGGVRLGPLNVQTNTPENRRFLVTQPLTSQVNAANKNAVIDLTDEEEARAPSASVSSINKTTNLVKVTSANGTGFVSIPSNAGAQYLLVNNNSSVQPGTAVVVTASMGTNANVGANSSGPTRLILPNVAQKQSSLMVPAAVPSPGHLHPAPLPRTAPQQVVGGAMQLPPKPTLKLSHKENSIVLSWTMAKTSEHEAIASYQLIAYQESNQPPMSSLWKKVGSVKALELPMACTLTQFVPGHRYHFAVRAVDAKSRLGPFSEPRSIRLEK